MSDSFGSFSLSQQLIEAESKKIPEGLHDEIAKIAFTQLTQNLGKDLQEVCAIGGDVIGDMKAIAHVISKVSFDFADEFMRERYERLSVYRASIDTAIAERLKG